MVTIIAGGFSAPSAAGWHFSCRLPCFLPVALALTVLAALAELRLVLAEALARPRIDLLLDTPRFDFCFAAPRGCVLCPALPWSR
jgi:hypothetical protein